MWRSSFAATISCRCRTTLLPRAFSSPSASFGSWSMGYNFDRRKINFRQLSTRNDFDLEAVCSAHMEVPEQEFVLGCSFLHQIALGTAPALLEQKFPQLEALVNFRDYDRRTRKCHMLSSIVLWQCSSILLFCSPSHSRVRGSLRIVRIPPRNGSPDQSE